MATNLQIGDTVFIPRSKLDLSVDEQSAFHETTVVAKQNRSIQVNLPGGQVSGWVGTSSAHRNIGFFIAQIGNYNQERSLLRPLADSVHQFFRLLTTDDFAHFIRVRSLTELGHFWAQKHALCSHVIVISHGSTDRISTAIDGNVDAQQLSDTFAVNGCNSKHFVSLACRTGYADFARPFSQSAVCNTLVAPFQTVHGATASQFCQTYFTLHLIDGLSTRVAFKNARGAIPGGTHFRYWHNGTLTGAT